LFARIGNSPSHNQQIAYFRIGLKAVMLLLKVNPLGWGLILYKGGGSRLLTRIKPKALGALIMGEKDSEGCPSYSFRKIQNKPFLFPAFPAIFAKKALVILTKTGIIGRFRGGLNLLA
jgi:hypothetical protein